jgi:two-component system sensor histidine kinase KdpD
VANAGFLNPNLYKIFIPHFIPAYRQSISIFALSSSMPKRFGNKISLQKQYLYSVLLVLSVSLLCYAFTPYMGYRVVALVLLVTVSLIAISFEIFPVLLAAALSAFIWDFFFIPPHYTIHVDSTEDAILLIMYFIIAMVNAVLTYKIRQVEKLARLREEKAKAVKLYNTFLNSLSHELKTPIAAIIGATDNLQAGDNSLSDEDKSQLVSEIAKASFRLNQQVENLLNMSRIESGFLKPNKDWCDIGETIYEVVRRVEEDKPSQKISISLHPQLPLCKLDKVMLETVLYNLLNNAIRYTSSNNRITVNAVCFTDKLEIVVQDDGPGFPEEEIGLVFQKFYRLKQNDEIGTGLGLSIVKGFTEAMKGYITLENATGGGARFTIHLPVETSIIKV